MSQPPAFPLPFGSFPPPPGAHLPPADPSVIAHFHALQQEKERAAVEQRQREQAEAKKNEEMKQKVGSETLLPRASADGCHCMLCERLY